MCYGSGRRGGRIVKFFRLSPLSQGNFTMCAKRFNGALKKWNRRKVAETRKGGETKVCCSVPVVYGA
jgi:hypothetical protein